MSYVMTKEEVISLGMQLTFAIREYDMLENDAKEEDIERHYDRIISLAVAFSMEAAEEWRTTHKEEDKDLGEVLEDIHNHIATTRPNSSRVH
jgi:hypothetical protein